MGVTVREADHVAGLELDGLLAEHAPQAPAPRHRVELEDVAAAGHDAARDLVRRRRLGGPRAAAVDGEEDRAGEADRGEDVGEGVKTHSRLRGPERWTPGQVIR